MSDRPNPMMIGAFVAGAVALLAVALVIFGSGRLFEDSQAYVVYFDGSVAGLGVGAPVKFRGVPIGAVTEIDILSFTRSTRIEIPVYIETYPANIEVVGPQVDSRERVEQLIAAGLRAKLEVESLVTGKLYVSLDFYPETPALFRGHDTGTPEIPSVPSNMQVIENTLKDVVEAIRDLRLGELAGGLRSVVRGLDKLVNDPALAEAVGELKVALTEIRKLATTTNTEIGPLLSDAKNTLRRADQALDAVRGMVAPDSPLQYQLGTSLREVENAARSVRALADRLERQPDALLFGRGGEDSP